MYLLRYLILLLTLILTACTHHSYKKSRYRQANDHAPLYEKDVSKIPNATPRIEPKSRYGNPSSYTVLGKTYHVLKTAKGYDKVGYASWYGTKFQGHLTSTREVYDLYGMTAASTTLPLPTYIKVTNLENHRSIIVKVNDRGPFKRDRIIDLSYAAAKKLGYLEKGTALVRVTALDPATWAQAEKAKASPQTASNLPAPENNEVQKRMLVKAIPKVYIQVGAFSSKQNAEQFKWRLSHFIYKPIVINEEIKNQIPIFRVHIGPLPGTAESDSIQNALKARGLHSSRVTLST